MINPTHYTAHLHPGKFEGEQPETEYFYDLMLEGDGETLFPDIDGDICANSAEVFHINADEAEAFNLPIGHYFLLREDSQGFVYGSIHASRTEAEAKFQSWIS